MIQLGLVSINIYSISTSQNVMDRYAAVFEGVGNLKHYQVKLSIDKTVTPVAQPATRFT